MQNFTLPPWALTSSCGTDTPMSSDRPLTASRASPAKRGAAAKNHPLSSRLIAQGERPGTTGAGVSALPEPTTTRRLPRPELTDDGRQQVDLLPQTVPLDFEDAALTLRDQQTTL